MIMSNNASNFMQTSITHAYACALMACGGELDGRKSILVGTKPDGWKSKKWMLASMPETERSQWARQCRNTLRRMSVKVPANATTGPCLVNVVIGAAALLGIEPSDGSPAVGAWDDAG